MRRLLVLVVAVAALAPATPNAAEADGGRASSTYVTYGGTWRKGETATVACTTYGTTEAMLLILSERNVAASYDYYSGNGGDAVAVRVGDRAVSRQITEDEVASGRVSRTIRSSAGAELRVIVGSWGGRTSCRLVVGGRVRRMRPRPLRSAIIATVADFGEGVAAESAASNAIVRGVVRKKVGYGRVYAVLVQPFGSVRIEDPNNEEAEAPDDAPGRNGTWKIRADYVVTSYSGPLAYFFEY